MLHKELLWDFSFSVLGHGIITSLGFPNPPLSSWDGSIEETGTANKKCLMAADVDEKRVATALV